MRAVEPGGEVARVEDGRHRLRMPRRNDRVRRRRGEGVGVGLLPAIIVTQTLVELVAELIFIRVMPQLTMKPAVSV